MCNIVTYRFTCQHTVSQRRSKCRGTKHKITSKGIKAACVAESCLTMFLQATCDQCLMTAWDDAWKRKLERADTFLTNLQKRDMPAMADIALLVKGLRADYASASWNTTAMFASGPRPSITRVKPTYHKRAASNLPRELQPEDIIEKTVKEWADMDELDYDGNYEASTDPMHPVSTDYSHPLDNGDGACILHPLSEAEMAASSSTNDGTFDSDIAWTWGEETHNAHEETRAAEQPTDGTSEQEQDKVLLRPEAAIPPTTEVQSKTANTTEAGNEARIINQIITTFWSTVESDQFALTPPPRV
ncbi:hypothetical protein ACEQ8H_004522 [Pleosporales sp. CAS-2024a]